MNSPFSEKGRIPLVVCDESRSEQFVSGGVLWLPPDAVEAAVKNVAVLKVDRGIPVNERIHCRILFSGDRRRRSGFSHLTPSAVHDLLTACVDSMIRHGGAWFGAWVDRTRYPKVLRLVDGKDFVVGEKHLAGLACFAAVSTMQHFQGEKYDLAFDPDPTKIDWGLTHLQQATHFMRTHSNVASISDEQKSLLEMADVCAYATAQSILASCIGANNKTARLVELTQRMKIRSAEFAYRPAA